MEPHDAISAFELAESVGIPDTEFLPLAYNGFAVPIVFQRFFDETDKGSLQ